MKILVDSDACPKPIKEILYKVVKRLPVSIFFFANHHLMIPPNPLLKFILVPKGFDVADNLIVEQIQPGDLVITADIPLAAAAIEKTAYALNVRGEFYTPENIQKRLAVRNFMQELRDQGHSTKGPSALNAKDIQQFANALDRFLTKAGPK